MRKPKDTHEVVSVESRSKTMDSNGKKQKRLHILKVLGIALVMVAIVGASAVFATFAANEPSSFVEMIRAEAATEINSGNVNSLFVDSGTVSGDYTLASDITVTNKVRRGTFRGTLDGNGKTITISGDAQETLSNNQDVVGALFGTVTGTIKNVTIVFGGTFAVNAQSNERGTPDTSTTIYAGIVCGKAKDNAKFDNVELIINGTVSAVGTDGYYGYEEVKVSWTTKTYAYNKSCGQGAVAGGLIGRSEGAILNDVVLTNNGSIYAHGENQDAGCSIINVKSPKSSDTHGDRAIAGGLIGEIANKTEATSITVAGDGVVGAYSNGLGVGGTIWENALRTNAAGLVLGSYYDANSTFTCTGMWFKATGKAYVAQLDSDKKVRAGLLAGRAGATTTSFLSLWYNLTECGKSAVGQQTFASAPSKKSSVTVSSSLNDGKTIDSIGVGNGTITYTNTHKYEYAISTVVGTAKITRLYNNLLTVDVDCSEYNGKKTNEAKYWISALSYKRSGSTHKYEYAISTVVDKVSTVVGTAKITRLYNNLLTVDVDCSEYNGKKTNEAKYWISALSYKRSGSTTYKNIYNKLTDKYAYNEKLTDQYTFEDDEAVPVDCESYEVHFAQISKNMYYDYVSEKSFNNVGVLFTGTPIKGSNISSDLRWGAVDQNASELKDYTAYGKDGSYEFRTSEHAGTYLMVLYRKVGDTYRAVEDGEVIGASSTDAPNTIFVYENAQKNITINPAKVEFQAIKDAVYSKEYDTTKDIVGSLTFGTHFSFVYADSKEKIPTTPTVDFDRETSYFDSESVGKNKTITIVGLTVTGDYFLSEAQNFELTGEITTRAIGIEWSNTELTYNGSVQFPIATATNLLEGDKEKVSFTIETYGYDGTEATPDPVKAIDVAQYYAKVVGTASSAGDNYKLPTDLNICSSAFEIKPKEVSLVWTNLGEEGADSAVFSNAEKNVGCEVKEDGLCGEDTKDTIGLTVTYYTLNEKSEWVSTTLFHAADYKAQATISSKNYVLTEETDTLTGIKITPWTIKVKYYTGNSTEVEDLVYKGATFIGKEDGLHVKLITEGTGLTDGNLKLEYDGTAVSAGDYTATLSLVEGSGVRISDFSLKEEQKTQSFTILPKEVHVIYGDLSFVYDGDAKEIKANVDEKDVVYGDQTPNLGIAYEGRSTAPQNVGNYKAIAAISGNDNYVVASDCAQKEFTITQRPISDSDVTIGEISDQTYTGGAVTPVVTITFKGKQLGKDYVYTLDSKNDYALEYSDNVNAGEEAKVIKITGKGNFGGNTYTRFKINPKSLEITVKDASDERYYDGTAHELGISVDGVVKGEKVNIKVEYKKWDSESGSETAVDDNKCVNAGTYVAYFSLDESTDVAANYVIDSENLEKVNRTQFTISPKPIGITFSGYGLTYNGCKQEIKVDLNSADICDGDVLTVSITDYLDSRLTKIDGSPLNAGSYTAIAGLGGDAKANYTISGSGRQPFTIKPFELDVSYDDATAETTYNGSSQDITCYFKITVDSGYSKDFLNELANLTPSLTYAMNGTTDNEHKNCGTYSVSATCTNSNYIVKNNTASFTINPKSLEVTVNDASDKRYYDGTAHELGISVDGVVKGEKVNIKVEYKKWDSESGSETAVDDNKCVNAGTYVAYFSLDESTDVAANYVIDSENLEKVNGTQFAISQRWLGIQFGEYGKNDYDGKEHTFNVTVNSNGGKVSDGTDAYGDYNSGIVNKDEVNFVYVIYKVESESRFKVDFAHDVGTYVCNVAGVDNPNYCLYEDEENPLSATLEIGRKAITFFPKNVSKIYGDSDDSCDLTCVVDGVSGEKITVKMIRKGAPIDGSIQPEYEVSGTYEYVGYSIVGNATGDNYKTALNYDISIDEKNTATFIINKRTISVTPDTFTKDYGDPDPELTKEIGVYTAIFGDKSVSVTFERASNEIDAGIYNLKNTIAKVSDSANFEYIYVPGSNIDKFVIYGKAVHVRLNPDNLIKDFGKSDPDLYKAIAYINVAECGSDSAIYKAYNEYVREQPSDEGFPWANYVKIERGAGDHHTEDGYAVILEFYQNGSTNTDNNYRAVFVDENNKQVEYKFYINKVKLTYDDVKPEKVITSKIYDGNRAAEVEQTKESVSRIVTAVATYDDANVGTGKKITISFVIQQDDYKNDYELPEAQVYTEEGKIEHKKLNVTLGVNGSADDTLQLMYGETAEGMLGITYSGFLSGENQNKVNPKIEVKAMYNDLVELNEIRDVASGYKIQLYVKGDDSEYTGSNVYLGNYFVNIEGSKSVTVNITAKSVVVSAKDDVVYEKPVDGTSDSHIDKSYYTISELLDADKDSVDIEFTQSLTANTVGETQVYVRDIRLSGAKANNYVLETKDFYVSARILSLVESASMVDKEVDYNGVPQTLEPEIDNLYSGATHYAKVYVKYKGRTVEYGGEDGISEAPSNVGEYTVMCFVGLYGKDGVETYSDKLAEAKLTVKAITPTIELSGSLKQVYGSFTKITAIAKAVGGLEEPVTVNYSFADENGNLPKFPAAGTYSVTATYEGKVGGNYNRAYIEQELIIKQKEITVSISGYENLVYDGKDRSSDIQVEFDGVVEDDTCEPVKVFSPSVVKDAGSYSLVIKPGNKSYKVMGSNSITFYIAKKTLKVTADVATAEVGKAPTYTIKYEGFVGDDEATDLDHQPSVKLTAGKVGVNEVQYNKGSDKNYELEYVESTYTITYTPLEKDKDKATPYLVGLGIAGGIGIVVGLGFLGRGIAMNAVYRSGVSKREIRKRVYKKKRK